MVVKRFIYLSVLSGVMKKDNAQSAQEGILEGLAKWLANEMGISLQPTEHNGVSHAKDVEGECGGLRLNYTIEKPADDGLVDENIYLENRNSKFGKVGASIAVLDSKPGLTFWIPPLQIKAYQDCIKELPKSSALDERIRTQLLGYVPHLPPLEPGHVYGDTGAALSISLDEKDIRSLSAELLKRYLL